MKTKMIVLFLVIPLFFLAKSVFALPSIPADSPLFFQFTNIELVGNDLTVPGIDPVSGNSYDTEFGTSDNWGLFKISTMVIGGISDNHIDINGGGDVLFTDGVDGQISGIFYDLQLTSPTTATGGYLDIYYNDTSLIDADVMAGTSGGPDAATVSLFTQGTFLVRLMFDTGILNDGSNTTLKSTTDPTTLGTSGQADSFASVDTSVEGAWTTLFNTDWFWTDPDGDGNFTDYRDVRFSTFYNGIQDTFGSGDNNWFNSTQTGGEYEGANALRSNDPGRAYSAIPEPGTMLLLGLGLLGFAGTARRRRS